MYLYIIYIYIFYLFIYLYLYLLFIYLFIYHQFIHLFCIHVFALSLLHFVKYLDLMYYFMKIAKSTHFHSKHKFEQAWREPFLSWLFSSQMYETDLGKTSMPESESPVLLDYLNLLWLLWWLLRSLISHN